MEYFTKTELSRLFSETMARNQRHWQMLLTAFYFGLRVSEVVGILGEDVQDGQLTVRRLKNSMKTLQPIPRTNGSPEFELRFASLSSGNRGSITRISSKSAALRSVYEAVLSTRGHPPEQSAFPLAKTLYRDGDLGSRDNPDKSNATWVIDR